MSKNLLKLLLWACLLVAAGFMAIGALSGIGGLLAYFQSGADPASALHLVPNLPPDWNVRINWLADDADTGRTMDSFTRSQIESAYARAWLQVALSYLKRAPYGLDTYFSGPALAAVTNTISATASSPYRLEQADTEHHLELHFYSADGSIVVFTDRHAVVAQTLRDPAGRILSTEDIASGYQIVMRLEDGRWQARHWVRIKSDWTPPPIEASSSPDEFVGVQGSGLRLHNQVFHINGINYYPQAAPWRLFWQKFDPLQVEKDFALIQSLGLNTVRIFIPFDDVGGPNLISVQADKLSSLLQLADGYGLKVIVTLFDLRSDYNLLFWSAADRQLEALLTRFRQNPVILAWDIKNEPDGDYSTAGKPLVDAWLGHTLTLARLFDPNHLLTIGWATPQTAVGLSGDVDFVSFHYYAPANEFPGAYHGLQQAVAPKPVLLSEFGLPTWNSFFFPNGHSEPEQAVYYADLLTAMRKSDAVGSLAWTLYDFQAIPSYVAGRFPWQTGPQKYLGIYRTNGTPKPAAFVLAPNARLDVTRPPAWARFLKPFWLMVFLVILLSAALVGRRFLGNRPKLRKR